jgi:hypothetical protein
VLGFQLGPNSSHSGWKDLRGAHLIGADQVPAPGDIRVSDGTIVCVPRQEEPLGLSLLWPVPGFATAQLETTRLPQRSQPYLLPLELVRHRLMRINLKREEWGLFDYPSMETFAAPIESARKLFVQALQAGNDYAKAAELSEQALLGAMRASEELCAFHARVFLQRRHQAGGFSRQFMGVTVPERPPTSELISRVRNSFDMVRVPLTWRNLQPEENVLNFDQAEAWVQAARKANLGVTAGPLLNFGVRFVPDWMYIWENDFETIFEYAQEHVRKTVKRFGEKVGTWIVASGLHADNALAFSFEQIMELTRMAASVVRAAAPKARLIIELTQPWGEYYARNQQTIPPLLYADMLVQGGVNFDAFGLQLLFGIDADGFHFRDPLQVSSLIDRLANLGKMIHITALGAPSADAGGGAWRAGWTEETHAAWVDSTCQLALSKPYVEALYYRDLIDGPNAVLPAGGLLRADGTPKPALTAMEALRTRLQNPPER